MWNERVLSMAYRVAVPLLLLLAVFQAAMALGLLPWSLFWGIWGHNQGDNEGHVGLFQKCANAILSALIFLLMARVMDLRVLALQPNPWLRMGAWIVTVLVVLLAVSYVMSDNIGERWILGTITVIAAIACAIVASSNPGLFARPIYEEITPTG